MTTAVITVGKAPAIEKALVQGDLSSLSESERISYYYKVCESLGLNPLTKPFDYIKLNGKLTLYAKKDCADQLRKNNNISIRITHREERDGVFEITACASTPDGREDEDVGAVNVKGLSGDALANARMKATTKSKRRVTLSICGLGFLDESELETIAEVKHAAPEPQAPQLSHQPEPPPHANGNSHKEQPKQSLPSLINETERKWVQAGYCNPGFLVSKVREWAKSQGHDQPIGEWPEKLQAGVGDYVRRLLAEIKKPAPPALLDEIQRLLGQLGWSTEYEEEFLANANLRQPGEIPNEHRAQAIILALQAKLREVPQQREPGDEPDEIEF